MPMEETLPENPASTQPDFGAETATASKSTRKSNATTKMHGKDIYRRIPIPPHRLTPLKQNWMQLYKPLVETMSLVVRYNTRAKAVEIKASSHLYAMMKCREQLLAIITKNVNRFLFKIYGRHHRKLPNWDTCRRAPILYRRSPWDSMWRMPWPCCV